MASAISPPEDHSGGIELHLSLVLLAPAQAGRVCAAFAAGRGDIGNLKKKRK